MLAKFVSGSEVKGQDREEIKSTSVVLIGIKRRQTPR